MRIILSTIFCFIIGSALTQNPHYCGNSFLEHYVFKKHDEFNAQRGKMFSEFKHRVFSRNDKVYRIPVVFHVVWQSVVPRQNIPDSCIHRQIQILNESFSAMNSDKVNLRGIFGMEAKDAKIEFYLADKAPDGSPTNGIIRKSTTKKFTIDIFGSGINIDMKSSSKGGSSPWDVNKYLNIWVVNMPLLLFGQEEVAVLGFATPPLNLPNWPPDLLEGVGADGVVIQYQFIGDNNPNYKLLGSEFSVSNRGRTVVHEVGHYLGLRHIWADKGDPLFGSASCVNSNGEVEDDGIDDTPYCGNNSQMRGCDLSKNTCIDPTDDKPDMWENYMDYSKEDCQVLFTPEQIEFMRMVLEKFRPELHSSDLISNKDIEQETNKVQYSYNADDGSIWIDDADDMIKKISCFQIDGRPVGFKWAYHKNGIKLEFTSIQGTWIFVQLLGKDGKNKMIRIII